MCVCACVCVCARARERTHAMAEVFGSHMVVVTALNVTITSERFTEDGMRLSVLWLNRSHAQTSHPDGESHSCSWGTKNKKRKKEKKTTEAVDVFSPVSK